MPLQPLLVEEALVRIGRSASAGNEGARQLVNYFVGQVVGSLESVKPARQVVLDVVSQVGGRDLAAGLLPGRVSQSIVLTPVGRGRRRTTIGCG